MWFIILWCLFLFAGCHGVIYHLNDTEYARMPALYEMDRHDLCLSDIDGLYCVVKLKLYAGRASELMNMIEEYSAYTSKHYNYTHIERGICVTKTCKQFFEKETINTMDLNATLEACLNNSIWNQYNLEAKLSHVYYCNKPNEQIHIDIGDWIVAALFVVLILLTFVGTFYDILNFKTDRNDSNLRVKELLLNFSLRKNWRKLAISEKTDPRYNILKGLHGIRSISACLVISAHVIIIQSMGFTEQPHEYEKTYDTFYFHLLYNGLGIVQVFFLMSAFIQAYNIQISSESTPINLSQLPKLLFCRLCRLTPAYAVMIAFSATWMRHVGSGPLWRLYVSDSVVAQCRRFWWLHLTYINNYVPEDKYCALQTWHVAADTQLFIVCMVVYLTTKSSRRTLALLLMLLVGMVAPALHVYQQDFNALVLQTPELLLSIHLSLLPMTVITQFIVSTWRVLEISNTARTWRLLKARWGVLSWLIIPAICCLFLSGRWFYAEGEPASLGIRAFYAGTQRVAMGILVASGFISLTMRLSESFCNFFEWDGWLIPSKLSYSVYLLHMNLVHILLGLRSQLGLVSTYNLLVTYFGVLTISAIIAVPFYIMVEAPMRSLLLILFKSKGPNLNISDTGKKSE